MNVYAMSTDTGAVHVTIQDESGATYDLVGIDPQIDIDMIRERMNVDQVTAIPGPRNITFTLTLTGIKGISRRG